jgi:hypothetical protein
LYTLLLERSPISEEMIQAGAVGFVGGTLDITTGEVRFLC